MHLCYLSDAGLDAFVVKVAAALHAFSEGYNVKFPWNISGRTDVSQSTGKTCIFNRVFIDNESPALLQDTLYGVSIGE